ncbi:MAG TPA: substrate-binding domain-containing protein [Verrucomicrobiae bacterium]|nr:substrate-binding domain-containing protein [Verrucomicrobiae bacterium]
MRVILCVITALVAGCGKRQDLVTVYASQDQAYAEPILADFSRQTGIRVHAIYDNEAVKTVGLVNRLIAEKNNPQCDVFWNNEALRTHQLEARRVLDRWVAFGFRSRRVVINTNLVSSPPKSLIEVTNAFWKGKVVLAYPLFGTTATHFLALRQHWGAAAWERWCRALQANHPLLVDGNSVVVQMVGRGEAAIGLTDSDDIAAGQKQGLPVQALPLDELSLLIPNTVAIIRQGPHAAEARHLFDYLQTDRVREALIAASALEALAPRGPELRVDWPKLLVDLDAGTATLKQVFLR